MRSGLWISAALFGGAVVLGSWLIFDSHSSRDEVKREKATSRAAPVPPAPARHDIPASLAPPLARPAAVPSPADEAPPPEPVTTREQRIFELQQKYDAAPAPDARAAGVGRALTQDLERGLIGDSRLVSIDCKATICRAVVAFPSVEEDRATFDKLLLPMEGPVAEFGVIVSRETSPDGAVTSTIFVPLEKPAQAMTRQNGG